MENKNNYKMFQNKDCKYYPCHKMKNMEDFNCLFCYCPLYLLGEDCGGNFKHTKDGVKDCSGCTKTHNGEKAWDYVASKFPELIERARKK